MLDIILILKFWIKLKPALRPVSMKGWDRDFNISTQVQFTQIRPFLTSLSQFSACIYQATKDFSQKLQVVKQPNWLQKRAQIMTGTSSSSKESVANFKLPRAQHFNCRWVWSFDLSLKTLDEHWPRFHGTLAWGTWYKLGPSLAYSQRTTTTK